MKINKLLRSCLRVIFVGVFILSLGTPSPVRAAPGADLHVNKVLNGASNFTQGEQGRTYTITVSNLGDDPTDGSLVTVTDTLPTGLTATAISGTGWTCILGTLTCTRSDVLAGDEAIYPPITLTVNVAVNAPTPVTNTVTVSGGGDNDPEGNEDTVITAVTQKPDLVITNVTILPPNPKPNETFDLNITVKNEGGETTDSLVYRDVYINRNPSTFIDPETGCPDNLGDYFRHDFNNTLPPNTSDTKSVTIPGGLPAGTHTLWVYVDAPCINDESIENNNVYIPITVKTGEKKVFRSVGPQDGWILESTETSKKGNILNRDATILQIGDDALNRQYISILSFKTAALPDNAVITKVTLRIRQQGIIGGGNPVNMLQGFMIDIKRGTFGTPGLVKTDFQANAQTTLGPIKKAAPNGWYVLNLTPRKNFVNKLTTGNGTTQIRLRFKLDDNNNNKANILKLFSGNAGAANRPQLIVEYYIP